MHGVIVSNNCWCLGVIQHSLGVIQHMNINQHGANVWSHVFCWQSCAAAMNSCLLPPAWDPFSDSPVITMIACNSHCLNLSPRGSRELIIQWKVYWTTQATNQKVIIFNKILCKITCLHYRSDVSILYENYTWQLQESISAVLVLNLFTAIEISVAVIPRRQPMNYVATDI